MTTELSLRLKRLRFLVCVAAPPQLILLQCATTREYAVPLYAKRGALDKGSNVWISAFYHAPTFGIDAHGSAGGSGSPCCSSSIEILSGERTKAM